MVLDEPLDEIAAKRVIRNIVECGTVRWTAHTLQRLPALENGTWRYRVRGGRITIVVAFRSEDTLVVITAWRTGEQWRRSASSADTR